MINNHIFTSTTQTPQPKKKTKQMMKRFVLVHGGCHGAWCWYKVKPLLEQSGHNVTVCDLTASGINMSRVEEIQSLKDYAKPLLQILESFGSDDDKVILVSHSLGGLLVALAADMFPSKISVAVFVSSFMPDTMNPPTYVFEKFFGSLPKEEHMDMEFGSYGTKDHPLMSILLGPNYLKKLYLNSPIEDYELAKTLVRVGPAVTTNLTGTKRFTEQGYGSINRVYIVCGEDKGVSEDFQRWMIQNYPVNEVMEIKDADHMAMFSKPYELCDCLLMIAHKYA